MTTTIISRDTVHTATAGLTIRLADMDTHLGSADVKLTLGDPNLRTHRERRDWPRLRVLLACGEERKCPVLGVHLAGDIDGRGMSLAPSTTPEGIRRALQSIGVEVVS